MQVKVHIRLKKYKKLFQKILTFSKMKKIKYDIEILLWDMNKYINMVIL